MLQGPQCCADFVAQPAAMHAYLMSRKGDFRGIGAGDP